jgi:hypothetical protein
MGYHAILLAPEEAFVRERGRWARTMPWSVPWPKLVKVYAFWPIRNSPKDPLAGRTYEAIFMRHHRSVAVSHRWLAVAVIKSYLKAWRLRP